MSHYCPPIELFEVLKYFSGLNFVTTIPQCKYSAIGLTFLLLQVVLFVFCLSYLGLEKEVNYHHIQVFVIILFVFLLFVFPIIVIRGIYVQWESRCKLQRKLNRMLTFLDGASKEWDLRKNIQKSSKVTKFKSCVWIGISITLSMANHIYYDTELISFASVCDFYSKVVFKLLFNVIAFELVIYFQSIDDCFDAFYNIIRTIKRNVYLANYTL